MLLDTCALLWLAQGEGPLSPATMAAIDEAAVVAISAISAFEITLKHRAGKLQLPLPPDRWLQRVLAHHDLAVIELDLAVCQRAALLPPHHKDPCDRFIIATALAQDLPVVTADQRFAAYGVRVLA